MIPSLYYKYYSNEQFGGRKSTDFCPLSQEYYEESNNYYYISHYSNKENFEYGSKIPYKDFHNEEIDKTNNKPMTWERFSW